ncbi:uncharacterized protein LOC132696646 [Cylas formicarius]|uniref:uncharacterized protein LOC132696646 n=1 Tax=Cylas formicarius TaxID=197179 RepID=UPI00295895EB|nr:uncharacterized protein LOC132696646 [Cylas formicarius]XP_060517579.1 uncharacterized protein LOC132696646 [Cylas formicarius]XP_060517580.1 uncharacterized protein LOC132696646 [Cylas formicarius]
MKEAREPENSFLSCTNCLGFYRSKFLYRHTKKCTGASSSRNAQVASQNFLIKNLTRIDQQLKDQDFPRMRPDQISLGAKNDFLICAFRARYLKTHREKNCINVTSRKMRELSRIFFELKKMDPNLANLFEALQPKHYDKLVEATKSVARFDSIKEVFVAPTYAMNISTSLRQCCDIATYMTIKSEPSVETTNIESRLKTMVNLFSSNWRFDISIRYIETVYCRIILVNRRRPGELQRLLKDTYVASEESSNSYEEFSEVIWNAEKILLQPFKRIVIRGKRGRVPVIFSHDVQVHIDQLLQARSNFVNDNNPYLFANPNTNTPICGYKVVAKYAKGYGAKNPEAITCSRLRIIHLATLTQLFNLFENEIEQLSNFMGHTSNVHRGSNRLPNDVYQTA